MRAERYNRISGLKDQRKRILFNSTKPCYLIWRAKECRQPISRV